MAKDPAILWYWSDWRGGTGTFTRHLKGCYMDLLDAQFNSGPLSMEEIRTVLGTDFGQAWPTLQKKFTATNAGLLYNERMEGEKEKRKRFTDSRRNNLTGIKKHPHKDDHMGNHMAPHMENENGNSNGFVKNGGPGETRQPIVQAMTDVWKGLKPDYPFDVMTDGAALFEIGEFLSGPLKIKWIPESDADYEKGLEGWKALANWVVADDFYKSFSLAYIAKIKTLQTILQKSKQKKNGTAHKSVPYSPQFTPTITDKGSFGEL